jgi:uncharacterized membrane protein YuzA (DUF378 family)
VKFAFTFGFGALGIVATGLAWRVFGTPGAIFYFLVGTAGGMLLLYLTALRCLPRPARAAHVDPAVTEAEGGLRLREA